MYLAIMEAGARTWRKKREFYEAVALDSEMDHSGTWTASDASRNLIFSSNEKDIAQ